MNDYEIPINNSAGRLVQLFKKTIEIGNKNGHKLYISIVCEVLDLPDNSLSRFKILSDLLFLISQVENDLTVLTKIKIINHQKTLKELKEIFLNILSSKFAQLTQLNTINSYLIRDLENCADSLNNLANINVIEEDQLNEIIHDIDELYQSINLYKINKELKTILLKKISSLKKVIENYSFLGSDGIKRELEEITGSILLNKDKIQSNEEANLVKKVLSLVAKLIPIASASKNLLPDDFTEIISNILPPGQ